MKIRMLQCDPMDPGEDDQVQRIRHQTHDNTIEYIRISDTDPISSDRQWDLTVLCTSGVPDQDIIASVSEPLLIIGPEPVTSVPCWQISKGLIQPWDGEWLVKMISQLLQHHCFLHQNCRLEFIKVKKERRLSCYLQQWTREIKEKEDLLQIWLFVQDRQPEPLEEDVDHLPVPVHVFWIKQKAEVNVACFVRTLL